MPVIITIWIFIIFRLTLPGRIVEDGREKAVFDIDKGRLQHYNKITHTMAVINCDMSYKIIHDKMPAEVCQRMHLLYEREPFFFFFGGFQVVIYIWAFNQPRNKFPIHIASTLKILLCVSRGFFSFAQI